MKLVLKLKLQTDKNTDQLLRETCQGYREVCNRLSEIAFLHRTFFKHDLQKLAYHSIRVEFDLPSQLVIRAIAEVCSSYKSLLAQIAEHNQACKPEERRELQIIAFHSDVAVPYDPRVLLVDQGKQRVSLRTLSKRVWLDFEVGEKRKHLLPFVQGQADLKRYGKKWFLFQTIEVPEAEPISTTNHIGVDLGICTVASSTDGSHTLRFPGDRIRKARNHHYQLRRGLQRHNTKSSRKRVRKLRDKESRIVRDYNHLISRRVIAQAQRTNSTIVLEDLEGIRKPLRGTPNASLPREGFREGVKVRKSQRRERFSWAYAQLIGFIVYKAKLAGIPVLFVPPAYTSKTCSQCHYMHDSNRVTQAWFECKECGFCWNADDNAAINIRFLGAESVCQKRTVYMQEYLHTDRRKPLCFSQG
ncbi:MAG: Transposase [Chthonomonadaceae bacterium]|nr:Transposase [Chthonomonadaceae bacterium]